MRGNGMGREVRTDIPDHTLWQRSRLIDATEDDAARFLDLAAFADGSLDTDEQERVAEWLARHPDEAQDILVARTLASAARQEALPETMVARACAIVPGSRAQSGSVVSFRPRLRTGPVLRTVAQWGSLAAALVVAGWLGFTLGMDTSGALVRNGRAADDGILQELLVPSPGLMRDLTGGA